MKKKQFSNQYPAASITGQNDQILKHLLRFPAKMAEYQGTASITGQTGRMSRHSFDIRPFWPHIGPPVTGVPLYLELTVIDTKYGRNC